MGLAIVQVDPRFFVPGSGIAEDPVTGSSTAPSAPTGPRSSARRSLSPTRPRRAAAWCGCAWPATAWSSAARPWRCSAASWS